MADSEILWRLNQKDVLTRRGSEDRGDYWVSAGEIRWMMESLLRS